MTEPAAVRVERLTPENARAAAEVIVASHADYPGFRAVFPDPGVRARVLRPFLTATTHDAARHGHPLVAHDDRGPVGLALWMPPGTFPPTAARQFAMTSALLRAIAAGGGRGIATFNRAGRALMAAHPPEPAWFLQAMGVQPRGQRRGIGAALITPALALADAAGLPCYLQTSDPANVGYYQRFGFEVSQPAIETVPGGHTYIGMTRPRRDKVEP